MSIKQFFILIVSAIMFVFLFRVVYAISWTPASNDFSNIASSTARNNTGFTGSAPISISDTGTIIMLQASAVTNGWLSATDWDIFNSKISTSTNLGTSNFASANISQWTNNSGYITTSSNLGTANFTSADISQWTNNSGYIATSTYNIPSQPCPGSDKVSSISSTGTINCTTDETGAGAAGTVTTSTGVLAGYFPIWSSDGGTALAGSSTLFVSNFNLYASGTINASGTITQNGSALVVSSTYWALVPAGDLGGTWTDPSVDNDSHDHTATTISGLSFSDFTSSNLSNGTNDLGWVTSSSVAGIGNIIWGSATGSISITDSPTFTGTLSVDTFNATTSAKIPLITTALNAAGQVGISNVTGTFNFFANSTQFALNPEKCDIDFVIEVASSATQIQEDDYLHTFKATSTVTKLYASHKVNGGGGGNTASFNIVWNNSSTLIGDRNVASTSARHLFLGVGVQGNVTSSGTSTDMYPDLVAFASTTINAGSVMRLVTDKVSSTQWGLTVCYVNRP